MTRRRKKHRPDEIVAKLRDAGAMDARVTGPAVELTFAVQFNLAHVVS